MFFFLQLKILKHKNKKEVFLIWVWWHLFGQGICPWKGGFLFVEGDIYLMGVFSSLAVTTGIIKDLQVLSV